MPSAWATLIHRSLCGLPLAKRRNLPCLKPNLLPPNSTTGIGERSWVARATHERSPIPVVLFGGSKLGFKHGKFLRLASGRPHNDLWISVAQALGIPLDRLKGQRGPAYDSGTYTGAVKE